MKKLSASLLLLFSGLIISPSMSNPSASDIRVVSAGLISYPSISIRRMLFEGGFSIQTYAEKADMYMNHLEQGWKVPEIHALNPDVTCLLYRNIRAVYEGSEEYQLFLNNDWILKDAYGNRIHSKVWSTNWIVDPGNPNYQQWVANWIKAYLNKYGYDGVFLDNSLPSAEIMWSTEPGPPINPRTGEPWTDEEFKEAVIALVNKVKATVGNKFVIGNGILHGQRFFSGFYNQNYVDLLLQSDIDGIESEAWIMERDAAEWYSEDKWLDSINFVVWLEENFLSGGSKMFLPVAQNAEPYNRQGESLPSGCTKEQYVTYSFASLLLAATSSSYYLNFGFYMPEDYPQSLFKIDLGSPLGGYYKVEGTHVYARDFSKVKVLVNPTYQFYSVNLSGDYTTQDGTPVTSPLTVSPHTGMILKGTTKATASAHVFIEHTYRGDLVVDIGVGDPTSPLWSRRIWNREGGSADNLALTIDLSDAVQFLPPSADHTWFLKVYDAAERDQGQIVEFTITYQGETHSSPDVPVPISDLHTSHAYIS